MTEEEYVTAIYPLARLIAGSFASRFNNLIPKDDLAQIGILAALEHFRRNGAVDRALMSAVIRRELIDCFRRETSYGKRTAPEPVSPPVERTATLDRTPEATLARRLDLERAMAATSGRDRRVLEGALAGETLEETGRALGVTFGRVAQRRNRVIEILSRRFRRAA